MGPSLPRILRGLLRWPGGGQWLASGTATDVLALLRARRGQNTASSAPFTADQVAWSVKTE